MPITYHPYSDNYAQQLLRGNDVTPRPDLVPDIASHYGSKEKILVDIGCGTGSKLVQMGANYKMAIGLEPSLPLLQHAHQQIQSHPSQSIFLTRGIAEKLPFLSHSVDVVTSILSWWDPKEIHRILKPQGVLLIECLGPEDKTEFTRFFGKDDKGWRGANLNTNLAEMKEVLDEKLSPFFSDIDIINQSWLTGYSEQGLWQLLTNTYATVRNFHPQNDKLAFEQAVKALKQENQIILKQNRLVIRCRSFR